MRRSGSWFSLLLGCMAASCLIVPAALAEATLSGTVTDSGGAVMAGVELKLIPSDPNLNSSHAKTNKSGKYLFGVIRPAKYRILATKEGMRVSRIDINLATPDDKSVWAFHEDMPYGSEVPEFTITGLTTATYDMKFAPTVSGPGKWGTGDPLSSVDSIVKTIEAGKAAEAEREIRRHLEQDPKSATFNYLEAFALNAQGRYDEALAAVDVSLASEPPFEGANLLRGKILEAKKDSAGALAAYRRETEVAKNPQVVKEAYIALAVAAEEAKRDEDAQFALEKLIEISPAQVELYRELANVYLRTGQKDKAAAMMAKVDSLGGQQDPNALYNLGAERFNAGDFEAAAGFFARSASAKPDFAEAHLRLGFCQLNLGKKAEAIASLKRFLELQPQGEDAKTAKELLQTLEKK